MAKGEQEVAVKQDNAVAVGGYNYGDQAGEGFEGTKASDLSIPFLQVLQSNSPQVEDQKPEGSTPGQILNSVTGELSSSVVFQPVYIQEMFVEWVPRTKGGGFVEAHAPESEFVRKALNGQKPMGKIELPSGNELIETKYVYGMILDETGKETQGFAVLAFTSTKIKVFRDWKTAMYMVKGKPPLFAFRVKVATTKQKNEKGTFFNLDIAPLGSTYLECLVNPVAEAKLIEDARAFRQMILDGTATAAYDTQESASGPSGDAQPSRRADTDLGDKDIPF